MLKIYFFILMLISEVAISCPGCAGASASFKSTNTIIILGVFILLTYIPFYILFRASKKFDPKNSKLED